MVLKMTLKDLKESNDIKYNESKFGNSPLGVGNIVWVKVFDENGIYELPVKIIEAIEKQFCWRCNKSFFPASEQLPKTCPKCRSPYWMKPRR
jgi:hypothetical protein